MKQFDLVKLIKDMDGNPKIKGQLGNGPMYLTVQKGSIISEIQRVWPDKKQETGLTVTTFEDVEGRFITYEKV